MNSVNVRGAPVILAALFFLLAPLSGTASDILRCAVKGKHAQATINVDAAGSAALRFSKGKAAPLVCPLDIEWFEDCRECLSPVLRLDARRNRCTPDSDPLADELFERLHLVVEVRGARAEGSLQWIKGKQPDICTLDVLDLDEIAVFSKRWRENPRPPRGR